MHLINQVQLVKIISNTLPQHRLPLPTLAAVGVEGGNPETRELRVAPPVLLSTVVSMVVTIPVLLRPRRLWEPYKFGRRRRTACKV